MKKFNGLIPEKNRLDYKKGNYMAARPFRNRRIMSDVIVDYYKPRGIPLSDLMEVTLELDEFEAIRLSDLDEMYQADAAEKMGVSRQTFGNIIKSAHKKIADALVNGKAIRIEARCDSLTNLEIGNDYCPGRGKKRRGRCM